MVSWIAAQRSGIIERLTEPFEPFGVMPKVPNPLAEAEVSEGSFRGYCWVGLDEIRWATSEGRLVPSQKGEALWVVALGHVELDSVEAMVAIAQSRLIGARLPHARTVAALTRATYEGIDKGTRRIWQYTLQISVPVLAVADNTPEPEPLAKAILFDLQTPGQPDLDAAGNPIIPDPALSDPNDPESPPLNPHTPNSNPPKPRLLTIPYKDED